MITQKDRVTVALFVIATTAIIVGALGVLWGLNATKPVARYEIVTTSSVSGLNKSAAVNYLGVNVGKVESMRFGRGEVRLTIAVNKDTVITKDTKAQLTPQGITGIQFIELLPGKDPKSPVLGEGDEIEFAPSTIQGIVNRVESLSGTVETFIGENKANISSAIANANRFLEVATAAVVSGQGALERVATRVEGLLDEDRALIRELLQKTDLLAGDLQKVVAKVREERIAENLSETLSDTKRLVGNVDRALTSSQAGTSALGDTIADLRSTARAASEAATAARDALSRLGPRTEEDLEAARATLEGVQRAVRNLEELSREVKGRPSLLVRDLEQPRRTIPDK